MTPRHFLLLLVLPCLLTWSCRQTPDSLYGEGTDRLLWGTAGPVPVPDGVPDADPNTLVPRGYLCYRAGSAIEVDGRLDDEAWQAAPWSSVFQDIEAETQPAPTWPRHAWSAPMGRSYARS